MLAYIHWPFGNYCCWQNCAKAVYTATICCKDSVWQGRSFNEVISECATANVVSYQKYLFLERHNVDEHFMAVVHQTTAVAYLRVNESTAAKSAESLASFSFIAVADPRFHTSHLATSPDVKWPTNRGAYPLSRGLGFAHHQERTKKRGPIPTAWHDLLTATDDHELRVGSSIATALSATRLFQFKHDLTKGIHSCDPNLYTHAIRTVTTHSWHCSASYCDKTVVSRQRRSQFFSFRNDDICIVVKVVRIC